MLTVKVACLLFLALHGLQPMVVFRSPPQRRPETTTSPLIAPASQQPDISAAGGALDLTAIPDDPFQPRNRLARSPPSSQTRSVNDRLDDELALSQSLAAVADSPAAPGPAAVPSSISKDIAAPDPFRRKDKIQRTPPSSALREEPSQATGQDDEQDATPTISRATSSLGKRKALHDSRLPVPTATASNLRAASAIEVNKVDHVKEGIRKVQEKEMETERNVNGSAYELAAKALFDGKPGARSGSHPAERGVKAAKGKRITHIFERGHAVQWNKLIFCCDDLKPVAPRLALSESLIRPLHSRPLHHARFIALGHLYLMLCFTALLHL